MTHTLLSTPLFEGLTAEEFDSLWATAQPQTQLAEKGDIIALRGVPCHALMLLTEGVLRCEATVAIGETLPVERLRAPGVISPGLLYAPDNRFPVHWVAETPVTVVSIGKGEWTALLQRHRRLLENFLTLISDATKPLSDKIVYRTFKTIKGKFSRYLLDQAEIAGSDTLRLELTQREMAELFGVTRPALARAIGEMSDEGSIYVDRKAVTILFPEKLRQYIG
ncbi:MAG: Crp/Fnr family transcriptional regulator [Rikenellaceae bacterium]|jgi:CRP-like cAMP-binding protein|nr:Crp/Fnr family transcriptional regulator [Rikenellaceae bacterium]